MTDTSTEAVERLAEYLSPDVSRTLRALATERDALKVEVERLREEAREQGFWAGRRCGGSKAEIDAALAAIRAQEGGE